ncbi:hypothetical protein BXT89_10625 [Halopseudomonas pachastrellae]|uniref:Uncharacterized protein n=1 Tax=Halopseudomonas pachastrellae TaxID=254161 RepID=A0A1S8DEP2_9GAMM|nr:hypothetical protein BXT89_10625 [Halopseudomonas pachastrellae]
MCRAGFFVAVFYVELLLSQLFAFTASQGELLAQLPLGFAVLLDLSGRPRRPLKNSSLGSSDIL